MYSKVLECTHGVVLAAQYLVQGTSNIPPDEQDSNTIAFSQIRSGHVLFLRLFPSEFYRKWSPRPKNVLERRTGDSTQSVIKSAPRQFFPRKSYGNFSPQTLEYQLQVQLWLCTKVTMGESTCV